ncbi:MAG: sigma-54-dependent Fis family transcriptional regulator [Candidatus Riflebacteria bacterium]|nr:sigma-54-dependent Fis family transcriptional regulator [Candidatus Riflebacteria bacterium]
MSEIFTNPVEKPYLLLERTPEIVIFSENGSLKLEEVPEWLSKCLGIPRNELIGRNLDDSIEQKIPGIMELARSVLNFQKSVDDYQTVIIKNQKPVGRLTINARPFNPGERRAVVMNITLSPVTDLQSFQKISSVELPNFLGIVGNSPQMQRMFNKIKLYAVVDAPVLISGETGSGKEGVARALHVASPRNREPFVAVNCSSISETLFESELFGHEKGSFTGAMKSHKGRFERANKGTLFLDEMGDLPLPLQAKLLRAMEEQKIERVGSENPILLDVRLIAATNRNLEEDARRGIFRVDLFYRIGALEIRIPPLRDRIDDLSFLVEHFIRTLNKKYNRNVACLTPDAIHLLKQYRWPGNVRELRNLMERLFAENQTELIGLRALKEWYEERVEAGKTGHFNPNSELLPYKKTIQLGMEQPIENLTLSKSSLDADSIKNAFQQAKGNMTRAAGILGVHKATLYRNLKQLKLDRTSLSGKE